MTSITNWASKDGEFRRIPSVFRDWISSAEGAEFPPEKGRYHLYVSHACPWANRAAIVRNLKGLQDVISLSVVHWHLGEEGWAFDEASGCSDPLYGKKYLRDIYFKAQSDYDGRYTVPVLWDKKRETIVNNESAEVIRILNHAFDEFISAEYKQIDLYPKQFANEIDELNEWVYDTVNNGVYKSGFATTQEAYECNVKRVFSSLDRLEKILEGKDYLIGNMLTEADVRLFTTSIRFDVVYVQHFKCNIRMIRHDYPNLHRWLRRLYWSQPGFKETIHFDHIKKHYTKSHTHINPYGITPVGPIPDIYGL